MKSLIARVLGVAFLVAVAGVVMAQQRNINVNDLLGTWKRAEAGDGQTLQILKNGACVEKFEDEVRNGRWVRGGDGTIRIGFPSVNKDINPLVVLSLRGGKMSTGSKSGLREEWVKAGSTPAAPTVTLDPNANPAFGEVKLDAGFQPDPFRKEVVAGGDLRIRLGDFDAYVAKEPDFKLYYKAGGLSLTIWVDSKADTTLFIHSPDGKWYAVDDSDNGKNLNPVVKIGQPQSGRYDIWVGTTGKENAKATLFITELK